jgi:hypothetical protein
MESFYFKKFNWKVPSEVSRSRRYQNLLNKFYLLVFLLLKRNDTTMKKKYTVESLE